MFHDFQHEKAVLAALFHQFLRRTFDIRRGEEPRVFLMLLYIFLVVSTLLVIKPVSNALFLAAFGADQLPYAFLLVSVFAAASISFYTRQIRRISYDRLVVKTLYLCVGSLALFWLFIFFGFGQRLVLYFFYIWTALFAVIVTSQFWLFANVVFNPREAKRLFGVIGAGAIAGGIFGGYLTTLLAPIIGSSQLLLVCIVFLLICAKIAKLVSAGRSEQFHALPATSATASHPIRLLLSSRHLAYLAGIVGISVLVAKLVEFQFSAIAVAEIQDGDSLTAFFGFWLSTLNIISLLIQLFLTARVVGSLGVGSSLLFLPIAIMVGTLGVLISPVLWAAVFLKICDGSLKQSINKAGMELLALPIPNEIKRQAKSLVDVLVDSAATGISGLLLIAITLSFSFSIRAISLASLALLAIWIYLVIRVRGEYIESFRLKIDQGLGARTESERAGQVLPATELEQARSKSSPHNASILEGIVQVLAQGSDAQIVNTLRMIADMRNPRLMPGLEALLNHPSPGIKTEALRQLYFYPASKHIDTIRSLIDSPDPAIKTQVVHYLFRHSPDTRRELLNQYLGDEDYVLRGVALLCAAREGRDNDDYKHFFQVAERVEAKLRKLPQIDDPQQRSFVKANCARVIGAANIPELLRHLPILIKDRDETVVRAAMLAMGQSQDPAFIPQILRFLKQRKYARSAAESLNQFGPELISLLAVLLADNQQDLALRCNIPRVIAGFALQESTNALLRALDEPDLRVRQAIIKALNQLRVAHPYLPLDEKPIVRRILAEARLYLQTLAVLNLTSGLVDDGDPEPEALRAAREQLKSGLEKQLDCNLERIFRLMGLKYSPKDIFHAYLGIRSEREELRLNAVEFLDNVLESSLKRAIIPIVESQMVRGLLDKPSTAEDSSSADLQCFSEILSGHDAKLRAQALEFIAELKQPAFRPLLVGLQEHPDSRTRKLAKLALSRIDRLATELS